MPDEIRRLINIHNVNTHVGARWNAIVSFALDSGVRASEMCSLRMEHLDLTGLRAKVMGKGRKERFVPFGSGTARSLRRYIHAYRPEGGETVFRTLEGKALTLNGLENIIKRVRVATGIDRLHIHLLRHTFATWYVVRGGDSFRLQEILGHTTLEQTREYVHLASQIRESLASEREASRPSVLESLLG